MRNSTPKNSASPAAASSKDKQTRKLQQQVLQREKEIVRRKANVRSHRQRLGLQIGGGILAVAAVVAAVAYALHGSSSAGGAATAVASTLGPPTSDISSPPIGRFTHVGTPLYQHGKPELLFIGAQYCPHCAGQRWAILKALDEFGSFSGLTSSTNDDGTIPTFDLLGATYTSNYVSFVHRDLEDRNHQPLETLSSTEQSLFNQYDSSGGIPLVVVGGYSLIGDGYNLADISGLSFRTVQTALQRGDSHVFVPEINAEANAITAFICHADRMKPASVCTRPIIRTITSQLQ